jgi:hypothetical protein
VANHIARLTSSGALDLAFNNAASPGINGSVTAIALQEDNGIVVGGQFSSANGVTRSDITRLLSTGATDPTINFGAGANGGVNAVVIQPADGNLVIGGNFTAFNGQTCDYIARLFGGSQGGSGSFQFTSASYQVDENGLVAAITIQRTGGTSGPGAGGTGNVSVAFHTANGSAYAGTNYTATSNNVAFSPGEVLETVYVPVMNDGRIESNLTVNLFLSNPSPGSSMGNQATAVLTILNDNSALEFGAPVYSDTISANGFANISVIRVGSTRGTCSVNFATTTNGTAVIGTDYYPTNSVITFNPGIMTSTVQVPVLYDTNAVGAPSVGLALSGVTGTGAMLFNPSNAVLTIQDVISSPGNLSWATSTTNVNAAGGVANLLITRSGGSSNAVSVTCVINGGTAQLGLNYSQPLATNIYFNPGQTAPGVFSIPLLNPPTAQPSVTLSVNLANPTGGAGLLAPTNIVLTVSYTNAVFAFTQGTNTVAENQGPANIVVQRFNNTNIVSTVSYATTNGTATNGLNYIGTNNGLLTFGVGQTFGSISIPVINHSNINDVAFGMYLFNPTNYYGSGPAPGQLVQPTNTVVVITPSAAGVSFVTNLTSAFITNTASATLLSIPVACSNPGIEPVGSSNQVPLEVTYLTVDGSAKAGINYAAATGTLTFTNGLATNFIPITIFNNNLVSTNLTFTIVLTNVTAPGVIAPFGTNAVVIQEGNSGLSFSQSSYSAYKNAGLATITVNRIGFINNTVSVNYFATNDTAVSGQNFYATNGTLVFTNGQTSQTFSVTLINNNLTQPNLSVLLGLNSPTNAQVVNPGSAILNILETGGSYVIAAGAQIVTNYTSQYDQANNIIGSNDTVKVLFAFRDAAGQDVTNLIAYLQATNGVTSPSPASQTYGHLSLYGHSVSQAFTFTANGTNALTISPTFQLYDNGKYIGPATFTFTVGAWTTTFANTNQIIIYDNQIASQYPSVINVSGLGNTLIKATVTLTNLSHQNFSDVAALVVSPSTNTLIMANVVGPAVIAHVTLTFDDAATNSLPQNNGVGGTLNSNSSTTNKPTQYYPVPNFP